MTFALRREDMRDELLAHMQALLAEQVAMA